MRIVLLTVGSRGDVQPFVALGMGLQHAGHSVRVAAPSDFEGLIHSHGLDFVPLVGSMRATLDTPEAREWMTNGRNGLRYLAGLVKAIRAAGDELQENSLRACQGADALIFSPIVYPAWHVAEKHGVPCASALIYPLLFRYWGSGPRSGPLHLGRMADRLSEGLFYQLSWLGLRRRVNRWRVEKLGLAPLPRIGPVREIWRRRIPFLCAFSDAVVPRPPHWADWHMMTGYWFLDRPLDWQPPSELLEFLDAGPPPVVIGFGSMIPEDPAGVTSVAIEALQRAGQRGVLQAGWAGLGQMALPDSIYLAQDIPHDWLFPRVAAVVHHGGAGTTASVLRAGIPSIHTPFQGDQFFWSSRVAALGVGPPSIPLQRLTAERLGVAIRTAVEDTGMRARAAVLGRRLRAEDGVGRAVELFEAYLRSPEAAQIRAVGTRAWQSAA